MHLIIKLMKNENRIYHKSIQQGNEFGRNEYLCVQTSVFRSVVVVVFHSKMYQNNIFFNFLKIIFDISVSK